MSSSLVRGESVQAIAQAMGVASLPHSVATHLAQDVEYRLRETVQDACKFMNHSNRQRLTTADIDAALRLRNLESLYGYSSPDPLTFRKVQQAAGTGSGAGAGAGGTAGALATEELFFVEDKLLMYDSVLNEPFPRPPAQPTLSLHWLAVDGVQPSIPQNPNPAADAEGPRSEDQELKERADSRQGQGQGQKGTPLVQHVLSRELQSLYKRIVAAVKGTDQALQRTVLQLLRTDSSLHNLRPYFSQFIHDEVSRSVQKEERGSASVEGSLSVLRMCRCLVENPFLQLDPFLQQLMQAVVTCVVSSRLCEHPTDDHWKLRSYAADLAALICRKYGVRYPNLQSKLSKTYHTALTNRRPGRTAPLSLTSHYGAIVGLAKLGHEAVKLLLMTAVPWYIPGLLVELQSPNPVKRMEAQHCYGAMLHAVGTCVRQILRRGVLCAPQSVPTSQSVSTVPTEATAPTPPTSKKRKRGKATAAAKPQVQQQQQQQQQQQRARKRHKLDLPVQPRELLDIFGEGLLPYLCGCQPDGEDPVRVFL